MTFPFKTLNTCSVSGGSGCAGYVPILNSSGVLDFSLMQVTNVSGKSGYLAQTNGNGVLDPSLFKGISASVGVASAGSVPMLNAQGQLDPSFLAAVTSGGGANAYLDVGGWRFLQGTGTIPGQSGGRSASATISFPTVNGSAAFTVAPIVIPIAQTNLGSGARGDNPVLIWTGATASSFTVNINSNDANDSQTFPTVQVSYLAIGQTPVG